jgi:hypothetical protein
MKFEPGKKYVWDKTLHEILTVTYIGICADNEMAVVEDPNQDLHFACFDELSECKKKKRFFVVRLTRRGKTRLEAFDNDDDAIRFLSETRMISSPTNTRAELIELVSLNPV